MLLSEIEALLVFIAHFNLKNYLVSTKIDDDTIINKTFSVLWELTLEKISMIRYSKQRMRLIFWFNQLKCKKDFLLKLLT